MVNLLSIFFIPKLFLVYHPYNGTKKILMKSIADFIRLIYVYKSTRNMAVFDRKEEVWRLRKN